MKWSVGGRVCEKGGCRSMETGGRVEDLEIDVLFLFFSLFADGKFAKFGPLGMEGYLRSAGGYFICKSGVVGEEVVGGV